MNALSPQTANVLRASSALSTSGADAELISVCAAFCDLERAYDAPGYAHESGTPEGDAAVEERNRIEAEQDLLAERMCDLSCTTLAGVQAMATALVTWDRELLKDGPAKDLGELITSNMVDRLLALQASGIPLPALRCGPTASHADADLLAVCAEFRASDAAYYAAYDDNPEASDEEMAVLANPIADSWDGMLDRMAQLRAVTSEGLVARTLALAQHSGIRPGTDGYPFAFMPGQPGGVTGRLLDMLLTDAVRMLDAPEPHSDSELLVLRPEFDRLHAVMIAYNNNLIPDGGTECADFDALCRRIAASPPATTSEGRAFQAAAAMHDLTYRMPSGTEDRDVVWLFLKGLAGPAYRSVGVER